MLGIDGPAAFLAPEAPDLGSKIQVLSVGPPRTTTQSPPASRRQQQQQQQHHHTHTHTRHPLTAPTATTTTTTATASTPGQSRSPPGEEPERDGDTVSLLEPKTDLHELLQKRGEGPGGGLGLATLAS